MKLLKMTQTIVALACLAVAASAQQPNPPVQGGATGVPTKGKVAVINTGAFQDQIGEFKAKVDALNRQFEPRVKEVQSKAERIAALENTIKSQSGVLPPARIAEMTEQLERDKRDYQRKTEDLEADGNRAKDQLLGPVREKLTKFVEAYTAKKGVTVLFDLGNAVQSNTLLWYDSRLDITKEFIEEYNRTNPVTAATPAPQKP